jgi:hypothetical protein
MISMRSSRPLASKPHDNTGEREQNPHYAHYNGLDVNFQEVVHSAQTENADVGKQKRFAEDRMDTHKNARLTPKGREEMVRAVVEGGLIPPPDQSDLMMYGNPVMDLTMSGLCSR